MVNAKKYWLKINGMNFKEYLKQLSIVILGILIAYWVGNIGSYYKERNVQKQVLQTILNEVKDNSASVSITLNSLDSLRATYVRLKNNSITSGSITVNYEGLSLRSIGHESAKYSGVLKDISYKYTSNIVENYEKQNSLVAAEELVTSQLLEIIKSRSAEDGDIDYLLLQIENLMRQLKSFSADQKQLLNDLSKII
jgi:hypothetical protein